MEPIRQLMSQWFRSQDGNSLPDQISRAGKWSFYFFIIGIIAGLGSILFHYLCQLGVHYFMDFVAGYRPRGQPANTICCPPRPGPSTGGF